MWLFSCFKHDPYKDHIKNAKIISLHQEEDGIVRKKREEDEQIQTEMVKEESLKLAEEEDQKRRLQESKEKGKSKQVNPPPSICNGCKSEIGDGLIVNAFGSVWHPHCICCLHCLKPIAMHEISNSRGQFHKPCYKEHCNPNCYVCNNKIPHTEVGIKYNEHPFWKDKYCPSHDNDDTAKCCGCERLESCRTKYVMLDDGRWLCRECMECATMDTDECLTLHIEIREFFESLCMKIEKEFHLFLVEKEALNKAEKEEKISNQYGMITRGICLSEEQMIKSVTKGPRMGPNNKLINDIVTESQWVVSECEVTAILILYGLPRILTGYILAHEMMHAWLRLNGYRNLKTDLEEGLCQVLARMWLEPQAYASPDTAADSSSASSSRIPPPATASKKGDQSDFEKRLVDFCKYQIETDDSPDYGLGFKKVNQMMVLNNHNLKDTLKGIVKASKTMPGSNI